MAEAKLRHAASKDISAIEALLSAQHLPVYSLQEFLDTFWVLEDGGRIVGSTGLELYDDCSLLRSVVVEESYRRRHLGQRLVLKAIEEARRRGVRRMYLFTMEATDYFSRFGFRRCALEDFEPAVRQSFQYRGISSIPELASRITPMLLDLAEDAEQG